MRVEWNRECQYLAARIYIPCKSRHVELIQNRCTTLQDAVTQLCAWTHFMSRCNGMYISV